MRYILLFAIFLSCQTNRKHIPGYPGIDTNTRFHILNPTIVIDSTDPYSIGKDTVLLNSIIDTIYSFPEVQAIDKKISKSSKGTKGVSFIVQDRFTGDTSYYYIQVGNNSDDRYTNIYNFLLVKKTREIKVYEPSIDSIVSLHEWQKHIR